MSNRQRDMFVKVLSILPRHKLDQFAKDFAGIERPWLSERHQLVAALIAKDAPIIREELMDFLDTTIMRSIPRRQK